MRKVPAPVVSVGCFAARDVFTEAVVEKFELKYVRSTRVDESCVRAPVMLGTMDRTTFWPVSYTHLTLPTIYTV